MTQVVSPTSRPRELYQAEARADVRASAARNRGGVKAAAQRGSGGTKPAKATRAASKSGKASKPTSGSSPKPAGPYRFYDSTEPQAIPAGAEVAVYADGPHPTPASAVAGRKHVLWIDVDGSDPRAEVIDVEPGCATPSAVPQWVQSRLTDERGSVAIVYTMISEWPAVQSAVASLPAQDRARIRWWIANPTGVPHLVPGSDATQWYWGSSYDISTALPNF